MFRFSAIEASVQQIDFLWKKTNAAKKTGLEELKKALGTLQDNKDHDEKQYDRALATCQRLLKNPEFTYKRVSMGGLFKSRSEIMVTKIRAGLAANKIFILLDKLAQFAEDRSAITSEVDKIKNLIRERNFSEALNTLTHLIENYSKTAVAAANFVKNWLEQKKAIQIKLDQYKVFPLLDRNFRSKQQAVYDLNEVKAHLATCDYHETISFIFAIDLHDNVHFSLDPDVTSHHSIYEGEEFKGAGEVYFKKTREGFEVVMLNNKSGHFLPTDEFLEPLKTWFNKNGFITRNTKCVKERAKLIGDGIYNRVSLR